MEQQHGRVKLTVERVYVESERVVAITLKSDYHIVFGHKTKEPTFYEVDPMVHVWARRGWDTNVYKVQFVPPYVRLDSLHH